MAVESPLDPPGTQKQDFLDTCEIVFLNIFTAEVIVKMLAYGFVSNKHSYLRDPWCQLDFVIVCLCWLPIIFPELGNYSMFRALRALRPLRALKRLPGMPLLIEWILSVLPKMGNVLMLFGFVFLVFGIVGMELFKGSLHYRCARSGFHGAPNIRSVEIAHEQEQFDTGISCSGAEATGNGGAAVTDAGHDGSVGAGKCPHGTSCQYFVANPQNGILSFDSVGVAFIAFIQGITFDEWVDPMYALMASFSPFAWIYFVAIVMIAGFFVVNLFLAVIFLEFGSAQTQIKADERSAAAAAPAAARPRRAIFTPAVSLEASPNVSMHGGGLFNGIVKDDIDPSLMVTSPGIMRRAAASPAMNLSGSSRSALKHDSVRRALLADTGDLRSDHTELIAPYQTPYLMERCFNVSCCHMDASWRLPFQQLTNSDWLTRVSTGLVLINVR